MKPLHTITPEFTEQELLCMANIVNQYPSYRFRRHPDDYSRLQLRNQNYSETWNDLDPRTIRDFSSRRAPLTEGMRHIAIRAFDYA